MIIPKRDHQEKLELSKALESIIEDLSSCPERELPDKIKGQLDWQRPRGDLFHWIKVLNRFDDIFEHQIAKYELTEEHTKLSVISEPDQRLLISCLKFTTVLLNHTSNRMIYNSRERIFSLLNTPTIDVRLAALEAAVSLSEVYNQSSSKLNFPKDVKKKVLRMVHVYPLLVPAKFQTQAKAKAKAKDHEDRPKETIIGDHFAFVDTLKQSTKCPEQWKSINFAYYKPQVAAKSSTDSLSHMTISSDNVRKLTIEQILDKASETLPKQSWFEFGLHAYVVKSFNSKSHDSIVLREKLLQCKLYALSLIGNTGAEDYVSSRVFEAEPYIFTFLADMILPENMDVLSHDVYFSAVKCLCCMSSKLSWSGELIRCLGANVNHGILYQALRSVYKRLANNDPNRFDKGYIYVFNLIGNLIQSPSLATRVASGGILKELMVFLENPSRFWWHASAAAHLLTVFLTHSATSIDEFISNNGFQLIIDVLGKEVDLALSLPPDPPKDTVVRYKINFRQANFIRYFMKLVTFLIQSDSGDRLRNLFDSPILQSFNKVFENPDVFGPQTLSETIDSVYYIIHNEPTAYSILNEANVIDSILDNYESFFIPDGDLLVGLTGILGAIALNKDGLEKVEKTRSIHKFFKIFRDPVLCKELTKKDSGVTLSGSFDELGRHYNSLKPIIIEEIKLMIKDIPGLVNSNIIGARFFTADEDGKDIEHWETSSEYGQVFDATIGFLRSMIIEASWNTQLLKEIDFNDMLCFLDIPNAPYDIVVDNYSLTDLFSYFNDEEEDKNNNFTIFCDFVRKKLSAPLITKFLNSPNNVSFFDQVSVDPPTATRFLREINGITIALVGMCVGSFGWGMMGHERYLRLAEIFGSDDGLHFLSKLGKLLQKAILEENFIRANMPKDVLVETSPSAHSAVENPKIRLLVEFPSEDKKPNHELMKTHSYKNALQMRTFCFHIIHSASDTFSYLGKICMHRRQDYNLVDIRRKVVKITIRLGEIVNDLISVYGEKNLPNDSAYIFVISRIIWYMIHQEDRGKKIIQTSLMMAFLQTGVVDKLRDVCIKLWDPTLEISSEIITKSENAIIDTPESLRYHTLHALLTLFYGVNDESSFPGIPSPSFFFNEAPAEVDISAEAVAYARSLTVDLFQMCLEAPLETNNKNGPQELNALLLEISRHMFQKPDPGQKHTFLPLDWRNVAPPYEPMEYLKQLGLPEASVFQYFKQTNAQGLEHFAKKEWTSHIDEEQYQQICAQIKEDNRDFSLNLGIPFNESSLMVQDHFPTFFKVVKVYPELANSVANLLAKCEDEALYYISSMLKQVNGGSMSRNDILGFLEHGMVLVKSTLEALVRVDSGYIKPAKAEVYKDILELTVKELSADINAVNQPYMGYCLDAVARILSFQDILKPEESEHSSLRSIVNHDLVVDGIMSEEVKESIFELLLNAECVEEKRSLSAITLIMNMLTKHEKYRTRVSNSSLMKTLIAKSFVYATETTEENQSAQRALVVLVRRCFEDESIVKANMNSELSSVMSHKVKKELPLFLKDCSTLALRSPQMFMDMVSEKIRLTDYDGSTLYPTHMTIVADDGKDSNTASTQTASTQSASQTATEPSAYDNPMKNPSTVISAVVSELISVTKKDILSTPEGFKPSDKKNKKLTEIFYNKDFTYACYLLQILIELLGSYMRCKLEFITYSKKDSADIKPRSTALNVLIHQIIPTQSFTMSSGIEADRKSSISSLAKLAILALMSTPVIDLANSPDPKRENPDMAFVRKFCTELIIKSMKDTLVSNQSINHKYSKLVDIFDLQGSLLSSKFRQVTGPLLNKQATKYDAFYIARSFIDNQIPSHISSLIAGFDLNFPDISKVIKSAIYPLNLLGKLKAEYQESFEEDLNDEKDDDLPEIEDDDREDDAPDLFKNSTLGMYDIEYETEDEYYDEELDDLMPEMNEDDIDDEIEDDSGESADDSDSDSEDESASSDSDMDVESEDASMAGSYMHEADEEEESSDYDSDDVEIIDTTAVPVDDSDASEFYFGEDGEEYDEGQEEDEMTSEYDESELEGWIQDFMDGEPADTDTEENEETSNGTGNGGVREPPISVRVDERFLNEFGNDETDESINEEDYDGIGIASSNRRRAGGAANSIFDALRPALNRNMVDIVSVIFDGDTGSAERMVRIINDGQSAVSRFDNAIGSIFEWETGVGGGRRDGSSAADALTNLYIKSTIERWQDSIPEYEKRHKDRIISNLIPGIVNRISGPSIEYEKKKQEQWIQAKNERAEKRKRREEEERKRQEEEARERERERESSMMAESSRVDLEPVMVRIGAREVDISGTDIDPEFFEALPDDMREEVFTQHIRERRANARRGSTNEASREIDPDFLDALPDRIREEILQQESMARYSYMRDDDDDDEDDEDDLISDAELRGDDEEADATGKDRADAEEKKKPKKVFFTPLIDKSGVAALIRLLFVPQTINKRESIHQALKYLCYNKQTRVEVVNLIVSILHEALISEKPLDKIFYHLTVKSQKNNETLNSVLPTNVSPIIVADQVVDLLLFLLENNNQLRYFFLTEHENPFLSKKKKFKNKHGLAKSEKYQINILLKLLDNNLLREDQPFMDLLSRILQLSTKPLSLLKKHKQSDKPIPLNPPYIPDHLLSQMVKFLTSNDCPNTTFRRAISAMQNLSSLENAQMIFSLELSDQATSLGQSIIHDLNALTEELRNGNDKDTENKYFNRFNASSSDQAKLLRVLTALDYMFEFKDDNKKDEKDKDVKSDVEELTGLYKRLALGSLWDALSDCLKVLEEGELAKIATILLPLIEALMVVCKHSKVKELQVKDAVKYQAKKVDFTKEPIESLFFSFTDEHKKILNQMVRTNPNLMSGPFGMLVRNPKVLEFDNKKNYFDRRLHDKKDGDKSLVINVRRDQVFLDSYRALFFKSKEEFRDSKLDVNFKGESGIDAGGVTREWYQVLSRQMFNPDYALFTPVSSDANTYHPNRTSYINPEHLSFFKFIGKVIGKAIYDNCFLDCHFSRAVYKRILGRSVSIKDMETLDLEYFKSLIWMLENDITDVITEDFSVETDDYGEKKIIDLIPNGRNIPVTEENKHDYVKAVVEYRLQTSVADQMDNFLMGFHEIIPQDLVSIFDEQELELLISGLPDIDVQDWQSNCTYNNYSPSSIQIQWFWRAVKSFDNEERAKLLQFATGTSKVPLNGFKELSGANGSCKFSIHRDYGSLDRLPSSHTCFNQIDLPAYESYETLRGSLLLAITEGHEGFGLA